MSFATVLARLAKLENPYPGLRPFDTAEAHLFFGREQQILDLAERLGRRHFAAVLGLSGSGKSSLVRAGLIPTLQRGRLLETGKSWRIAITRPGASPFANLAEQLACDPAELRASSHGLIDYARRQLNTQQEALLVVVDQFEELFRYKDRAIPGTVSSSEAAAFISLLIASSHSPLPIYIVITMRTDYLGDCAEFPDFPETLNESQYLVPRLTREQRRQAIEGPLGRARISPALVERILNDAGDEPDQLPILQHALMRTWSHWHIADPDNTRPIENQDYDAIAGFSGALNQHADELLKSPAVAAAPSFVEIIFKRLTALGRNNRERRDPSPLSELWDLCSAKSDADRQKVNGVINVFRQGEATFLEPRAGTLAPGTLIDIAHESLIRNWKILAERWLIEEEKHAKTLIELLDRARGWRAHEKDVLTGLDLAGALEWNRRRNPSPVWAAHYVGEGGLDEVQSFLTASRQRFRRAAQINRFLLSFVGLLLVGLLAFVFTLLRQQKANQSLDLANRAESLVSLGRSSEAIATASQALRVSQTRQAREALAHAFPQELVELNGHTGPVFRAVFSPDGHNIVTASADHTALVWNAATGQIIAKLIGHHSDVHTAVFSPDGRRVLTASADSTARVWDASNGTLVADLSEQTSDVSSANFSPNGLLVVAACIDFTARVYDPSSGAPLAKLQGHTGRVNSAFFSPDNQHIVTASADNTAIIWDAASGRIVSRLEGHTAEVKTALFSDDGRFIVTASADHTARIWNASSGALLGTLNGHTATVNSARFSPNGKFIVTASEDHTAAVWNTADNKLLAKLTGHQSAIYSEQFSPDSRQVVTASRDSTALIWDVSHGTLLGKLTGHSGFVYYAAYSPDGLHIVTSGEDNTARIWNVASAAEVDRIISPETDSITSAALSSNGLKLAMTTSAGITEIWDAKQKTFLLKLVGHKGVVSSVHFSPDNHHVLTAGNDGTARVWDSSTGAGIFTLRGHNGALNNAAYSSDGTRIITAGDDHTTRIWNAANGQPIAKLTGQRGIITSAVFSPDGRWIATASDDKSAWIWDATTLQPARKLTGHTGVIWTVAFSPNSQSLVTASDDASARLWNVSTGQPELMLLGHNGAIYSAAFSPDGKKILTAGYDATARIWDASSGQVTAKLEEHTDSVYTAAFSHDGQSLVTSSSDGTALIFHLVTLDQLTALINAKPGGIDSVL